MAWLCLAPPLVPALDLRYSIARVTFLVNRNTIINFPQLLTLKAIIPVNSVLCYLLLVRLACAFVSWVSGGVSHCCCGAAGFVAIPSVSSCLAGALAVPGSATLLHLLGSSVSGLFAHWPSLCSLFSAFFSCCVYVFTPPVFRFCRRCAPHHAPYS